MKTHRESIELLFARPIEGVAIVLLILGISSSWFAPPWLSLGLCTPHYLLGIREGRITRHALISLWVLAMTCIVHGRVPLVQAALVTAFGSTIFVILRDLPDTSGMLPPPYLETKQMCRGGTPLSITFDYHTPLLALVMLHLVYDAPLVSSFLELRTAVLDGLSLAFGCATVSFFFAAAVLQMFDVDPKIPPFISVWAVNDLFLEALPQELVFRGIVLSAVQSIASPMEAVFLAAFIYALSAALRTYLFHGVHAAVSHLLLAFVKGTFFGWTYELSGFVEAAVVASWAWDCLHFTCFTYPMVDFGKTGLRGRGLGAGGSKHA